MTRKKSVSIELTRKELVNLEVAVRLRVEALEDNDDPDTYGFKPLHKRLEDGIRECDGLLVHLKRKVSK